MKNTSSVLRIATLFLSIITLFSYGVYTVFFKANGEKSGFDYTNNFSPFSFENEEKSNQQKAEEVNSPAGSNNTVIPTAAGEVLGKIKNQTIKNDSANIQGGSVHIKNSTDLDINADKLLSAGLDFKIEENAGPQVLIIHTHATESYLREDRDYYTSSDNSRTTDNNFNVTELGAIISDKLSASGINTVHDRTQHDYPSYNGSYSRAAVTIKSYLKKYPSIKVVIDVHRDAIQQSSTKTKLTAEINGKRAAQVMLVMGSQSGTVKNFPNWQENLKLALRLQKNLEGMFPTLARPLSLMPRSYNEPLTTGSMLIEVGTDANAFEQAKYSAELLSEALIKTLKEV